jgi:hypothetical protein
MSYTYTPSPAQVLFTPYMLKIDLSSLNRKVIYGDGLRQLTGTITEIDLDRKLIKIKFDSYGYGNLYIFTLTSDDYLPDQNFRWDRPYDFNSDLIEATTYAINGLNAELSKAISKAIKSKKHEFKPIQGLFTIYYDCKHCGKKKEDCTDECCS